MKNMIARFSRIFRMFLPYLLAWLAVLAVFAMLALVGGQPAAVAAVLGSAALWMAEAKTGSAALLAPKAVLITALVAFQASEPLAVIAGLALIAGALADIVMQPLTVPILLSKNLKVSAKAPLRAPFTDCGLLSVILLAAVSFGLPQYVFAAVALLSHALAAAIAFRRINHAYSHLAPKAIKQALEAHAPRFLLYFSSNENSSYQLSMWIPYLERTGARYALIVREEELFKPAEKATTAPILLARTQRSLEYAVPSTVRAVFYVNNSPLNASGIRFAQLEHVQLGHGDSEKPSSYDKAFAMFDQIFVAGQAGVDRFARNSVQIPAEKFRIVGRPQLEELEVNGPDAPAEHTVLYAPTWRGGMNDMSFGSLAIGAQLVSA
ncbi:MAG: hypothetical protein LBI99_09440, partial [Propionibacteriaceae bacterium]|nr:hypothetical protein [Propionibacteriaceae bacterium]